jgi:hypothetical protein
MPRRRRARGSQRRHARAKALGEQPTSGVRSASETTRPRPRHEAACQVFGRSRGAPPVRVPAHCSGPWDTNAWTRRPRRRTVAVPRPRTRRHSQGRAKDLPSRFWIIPSPRAMIELRLTTVLMRATASAAEDARTTTQPGGAAGQPVRGVVGSARRPPRSRRGGPAQQLMARPRRLPCFARSDSAVRRLAHCCVSCVRHGRPRYHRRLRRPQVSRPKLPAADRHTEMYVCSG